MREIDKIAESLFEKIRSRFTTVNLGDENAKETQDPERARFFNFSYAIDGVDLGNVTVSLIDEESMKVYYGQDISDNIDEQGLDKNQWYEFLRGLRKFAKRNLLSFDTRDIAKSNLQIKDVKQQSKADSTVTTGEIKVTESRMYGTKKHSFANVGECTVRIVHSDNIDEEVRGARTRKIEAIFVETPLGERLRVKHNNLTGAVALAQHYSHGGQHGDEICEAIDSIMDEMASMSHFVRSVKRRSDLDPETAAMANSAVDRYNELKQKLKRLRSPRHYLDFVETYHPETPVEDEYDVDALRERFVKKFYDDRFDQALPFVYRAHKRKTEPVNSDMAEEFNAWADSVVEGTWAVPDQDAESDELRDIMSKPLKVGLNAIDATGVLYDIIGDDQLYDDLGELADIKGQDYDCRPEVVNWLKKHFPALGTEMEQVYRQSVQPEPEAQPAGEPVLGTPQPAEQQAAAPAQPAPVAESDISIDFIRQLAGLKK